MRSPPTEVGLITFLPPCNAHAYRDSVTIPDSSILHHSYTDQWKNPSGNPSALASKLPPKLCLETILPSGLIPSLRPGKMGSLQVKQALLPLQKGTADERPNSKSE